MTEQTIRFEDGAAYERYMGVWSRLVAGSFLEWLSPKPGLRWLDVGCGNGAFTEIIAERCAPASLAGVDPSEGQLRFARSRAALRAVDFREGDAMALPYADGSFDVAVMPLVIFFVSDPAKGVAEMMRVVRPGGLVAAYAWDMLGGGFPYHVLQAEMRALGFPPSKPPSPDASTESGLRDLWTGAGLIEIETRHIAVQRTFADFDDFWTAILGGPSVGAKLAAMGPAETAELKTQMRAHLPADDGGRITYSARANAAKGRRHQNIR